MTKETPQIGKVYWWIASRPPEFIFDKKDSRFSNFRDCLGFVRDSRGGALILGDPTGTHFTGHGERWESKMNELVKGGYIPLYMAIEKGLISSSWPTPSLTQTENDFLKKILAGVL